MEECFKVIDLEDPAYCEQHHSRDLDLELCKSGEMKLGSKHATCIPPPSTECDLLPQGSINLTSLQAVVTGCSELK